MNCDVMTWERGVWEDLPKMSLKRLNPAATVHQGKIYVSGTRGTLGAVVQRMNCDVMTWENVKSMRSSRCGHAAAIVDDHLYVCGGYVDAQTSTNTATSSVERLPLQSTTRDTEWETMPPMLESRGALSMVAMIGQLFVCGGDEIDFGSPKDSVECFDVRSFGHDHNTRWGRLPPMLTARVSHAAAAALPHRLFVSGGFSGNGSQNTTECFDIASGFWTVMPAMLQPRAHHASTAIGDTIYVCGGTAAGLDHPEE